MNLALDSFIKYNTNNTNNNITVVILCGGNGKRMNDYSFPKPLNMINGKPSIYYTLSKLPSYIDKVHFIVAPHLINYNFAEIVSNLNKNIKCIFHYLPYFTRGAVESAWLGCIDIDTYEPIIFMDNDNIYNFPDNFLDLIYQYNSAFLGYSEDNTGTEAFSFITLDENKNVLQCKEKNRISNLYCCGIYGFKNISQFKEIAWGIISNYDNKSNEMYMSSLYEYMIQNKHTIYGIKYISNIHLGSYNELIQHSNNLPSIKMRICFDLDNTLVTYPTIPGDYNSVKPIKHMIDLVNKLKENGHTIIIHTARRMQTHSHNIGSVIADIGYITFKTLEKFNIKYDEIIFGKPLADMYIDDRSINPYYNDLKMMGLLNYDLPEYPINKLSNNTNNITLLENDYVTKSGPNQYIEGEIYFYKNIPHDKQIKAFFPQFIKNITESDNRSKIYIENINGIPLYTLYQYKMITETHLFKLFEMVKILHACDTEKNIIISNEDIKNNYTNKLKKRFNVNNDYPFDDAKIVQEICLNNLEKYYKKIKNFKTAKIIHGDLWFSNIIVKYDSNIKFIDMKGKINDILTTNGDIYYDYGKLYQSFLGYDSVLYNHKICNEYKNKLKNIYEQWLEKNNIDLICLKYVTFSLVMGTFHCIKNEDKQRVWEWIKITFL